MRANFFPGRNSGSALIISLFFIGIITVVIVASLISSRLERSVAHSHFEQVRAGEFAREGVERAVATLQRQTAYKYATNDASGQTVYRYRNYLTQPGGLVVPKPDPKGDPDPNTGDAFTQNILNTSVPLTSGLPTAGIKYTDASLAAPSLNIPTFVQPASGAYTTYTVADRPYTTPSNPSSKTVSSMKLKWIYLRQDNTVRNDTANPPVPPALIEDNTTLSPDLENPTFISQKPIVGRFAYWTDDESTKINYNFAWKKNLTVTTASDPAKNNLSILLDPSHVSLQALFLPGSTSQFFDPSNADLLHTWTTKTPGRYFNSFADARQVDSTAVSPVLDYNNFELTHYNHDPDTTFFGEDRILLTTDPRLVPRNPDGSYARKFLDILREDTTSDFLANPPDPGLSSNIAAGQTGVPSGSTHYPGQTVTNKFDMVVRNLVRYIDQTNWPIMPNATSASFKSKYYPNFPATGNGAAVAQLAIAIIDYVRSRESAQEAVTATRFGYVNGAYTTKVAAASQYAFQGTARTMHFTEMGFMVESKDSSAGIDLGGVTQCDDGTANGWPTTGTPPVRTKLYRGWAEFEIHLPARYSMGVDSAGQPKGIDLVPSPTTPDSAVNWCINPILHDTYSKYIESPDANHKMVSWSETGTVGDAVMPITKKNLIKLTNINGSSGPNGTTLYPGGYAVVLVPFYRTKPYETSGGYIFRASLLKTLLGSDGVTIASDPNRITAQIVPQSNVDALPGPAKYISSGIVPDPAALDIPSVETDDPRCNFNGKDWARPTPTTVKNSWGKKNTRWSADASAGTSTSPAQDTDNTGIITSYSLYMPPPKDSASPDPQNGRVTSVGELGYVTTSLYADASKAGIPWRTIHLQPNGTSAAVGVLPDWVLLDLFAAPNLVTATAGSSAPVTGQAVRNPHGNSVGGRVNINAFITPFIDVNRDRALAALFHEAHDPIASKFDLVRGVPGTPTRLSDTKAEQYAQNIALQTLANGPRTASGNYYGSMGGIAVGTTKDFVYDSTGEICEIKGIADAGEVSEDLVREIASLTCTRSGVFSVYTIGQAIQQNLTGKLTVTSEQRQQTMVERYVEDWNTTDDADDQVRFRTVYSRNLTP